MRSAFPLAAAAFSVLLAVGCAPEANRPADGPAPGSAMEPEADLEPPHLSMEERRAAPFAVVSSGRAVPLRGPARGVGNAAPEAAAPDTEEPETGEPDTEDPDPEEPDTEEPDTEEPEAKAPDTVGAPSKTHAVVPGDTLWGIARRYGVEMEAIREANGLVGDIVKVGQVLLIPGS